MDYKAETIKTYDDYPSVFDKKFEDHFYNSGVKEQADLFCSFLKGKRILDAGSGPGNHAKYFTEKGLEVLCIDISKEMIRLCKEKGLAAEVMDLENITLTNAQFDGVWAYASLLHLKKSSVQKVVDRFSELLKPGGIVAVAVKEGTGEGFEESASRPGHKRWFTYFTSDEIRWLFGTKFKFLHESRYVFKKYTFLIFMFKLNE